MALSVKTKTQIRNTFFLVIGLGLCWAVYYNWNRILPALSAGTEQAFDATREIRGEAP